MPNLKEKVRDRWLFLSGPDVTDDVLIELNELPNLVGLEIKCDAVTDSGVANILGLGQLKELDLSGTPITDKSLQVITGLSNLEWLSLDKTRITDAGLKYLVEMPNLRSLWLGHTEITDIGMAHFGAGRLDRLTLLDLSTTAITDDGMKHLSRRRLTKVYLADTRITIEGLSFLERAALEVLGLDYTDLGDEIVSWVLDCPRLRQIFVRETCLTSEGTERLRTGKARVHPRGQRYV